MDVFIKNRKRKKMTEKNEYFNLQLLDSSDMSSKWQPIINDPVIAILIWWVVLGLLLQDCQMPPPPPSLFLGADPTLHVWEHAVSFSNMLYQHSNIFAYHVT